MASTTKSTHGKTKNKKRRARESWMKLLYNRSNTMIASGPSKNATKSGSGGGTGAVVVGGAHKGKQPKIPQKPTARCQETTSNNTIKKVSQRGVPHLKKRIAATRKIPRPPRLLRHRRHRRNPPATTDAPPSSSSSSHPAHLPPFGTVARLVRGRLSHEKLCRFREAVASISAIGSRGGGVRSGFHTFVSGTEVQNIVLVL